MPENGGNSKDLNKVRILVVCSPNNHVFRPIAQACYESLLELGYDTSLANKYAPGYDAAIFMVFYDLKEFIGDDTIKIGYHMEPLPWHKDIEDSSVRDWECRFRAQFRKYDVILDSSRNNIAWLGVRGIKAHYCPLGYHKTFEVKSERKFEPQYNTVLIGARKHRRRVVVRKVNKGLRQLGLESITEFQSIYGNRLADVIHNTDIHLNIHIANQACFESFRIINLLSNQQFVMSEPIRDNCPLLNGSHFVIVQFQEIAKTIKHYLERPQERDSIAKQGYDFIRHHYLFVSHLEQVCEEVLK